MKNIDRPERSNFVMLNDICFHGTINKGVYNHQYAPNQNY